MKAVLALTLLIAMPSAHAQTLTLAKARTLSTQALAKRVLRREMPRDVVEAQLWANQGGLIPQAGLNAITFYRAPSATGFPGLCRIDQIHARFSSGGKWGSDLPHSLREIAKLTEFALIAPTGDCAALRPLANRDQPRLFSLGDQHTYGNSDSASAAYFGALVVTQAQADTDAFRAHVTCTPDPADAKRTECLDPLKTVAHFPLARIETMQVYRCADAPQLCVTVRHSLGLNGNSDRLAVTLTIETNAITPDPAMPFKVRTIAVGAETWADD